MSTQAITSANAVTAAADTSTDKNASKTDQMGSGLGQDAFLKLLVTQLQHQDPLQPQDDSQFLAQLATFSSLEQLTTISTSIQQLVALAGGTAATSNNATSASSTKTGATSSTTGGN